MEIKWFLFQGIPLGPALLEYLYDTASVLAFSPDYNLILALFRSAMAPYIRYGTVVLQPIESGNIGPWWAEN